MQNQSKKIYLLFLVAFFLIFNVAPVTAQVKTSQLSINKPGAIPARDSTERTLDGENNEISAKAAEYKRALEESPDNPIIYNNLGTVYARQFHYQEAVAALKVAVKLNPNFAEAYYNLGIVYTHLNRLPEALTVFQKAAKLAPENLKVQTQFCHTYFWLEKDREAISCYVSLEKRFVLDIVSQMNYGTALVRIKNTEKALPILEKAARQAPTDPFILNSLGNALYKEKRYEEAVVAFRKALDVNPELEEVRYNLALTQLANKNRTAALKHYNFLQTLNSPLAPDLYRIIFKDKVIFVENK